MELLINTDASCEQKMERERFPLTHQGVLISPTVCNLSAIFINPFTFPLWGGPAQIQMLLTCATLIPVLGWHPLIASVPTKIHSVTPLCHSHWPWDITFLCTREEAQGKNQLVIAGIEREFPMNWRIFCSWMFHTVLYATSASQVSCTGREGELKGWREHTFLTTWYLEKTTFKF